MRATGLAELYVPIDVSADLPEPDRGRSSAASIRAHRRAGDRRHRGGAQPAAADAAPGAVRLPRQHDRQLLPAGGHPAARAGARRDGAGRPVPDGRRSPEGHRAHRGGLQRQPGCHGRVQPQHAAGAEPRAGRGLRSRGFEHRAFYDTGGPPDRDAPRLDARPGGRHPRTRAGPVRRGRVDPDRDQHQVRPRRASPRCSPPRGSGSRRGRPIQRRRSGWSSERPHEHAHPRQRSPPTCGATRSRRRRARRSRPAGSGPRWSSSRSRPPTWRRCPIEGDGCRPPAAVPPPVRRPAGVGRDAHRQGDALLHAARRRHDHLRAGRPARVQRPPCRSPSALLAVLRRSCSRSAPRPRGWDHAARRGHRSHGRHRRARRCCSRRSATSEWRTTSAAEGRPARG